MLATRASDASCVIVYVNQMGGQDELVFDGASLVLDASGGLVASAPQFEEHVLVVDLDVTPVFRKRLLDPRDRASARPLPEVLVTTERVDERVADDERRPGRVIDALGPVREVYEALVLGTRDYVGKNGFTDVVVGLSGGVDSSLVATIAVDA